jgi:Cu/Ag efflux protein CusF
MTIFFMRPFGAVLLSLSLAACMNPVNAEATPAAPVLGIDLGGAPGPTPAADISHAISGEGVHHSRGEMVMAHSGHAQAQGSGTVISVNAAARTINLSHGPIASLGWPAMTMDFAVAPAVDLQALKPGSRVNFTIEHADGDRYVIQSVTPAGGGR